jgi:hypothetical protein
MPGGESGRCGEEHKDEQGNRAGDQKNRRASATEIAGSQPEHGKVCGQRGREGQNAGDDAIASPDGHHEVRMVIWQPAPESSCSVKRPVVASQAELFRQVPLATGAASVSADQPSSTG